MSCDKRLGQETAPLRVPPLSQAEPARLPPRVARGLVALTTPGVVGHYAGCGRVGRCTAECAAARELRLAMPRLLGEVESIRARRRRALRSREVNERPCEIG